MAKEKVFKPQFPSQFGSHASMIDDGGTEAFLSSSLIALKDEHGVYITKRSRLDTGLADPNRYKIERLHKLFVGHKKEQKEE